MDPLAQAFEDAVQKDDIPGAITVARDVSGNFEYIKAFGTRTLLDGTKKPLEPGDVLAIYSCTKIITAVAAMQCVEKGLLALDEDIGRVLPRFAKVQVLVGFDGEKPQFEDKRKPVTLRHLLTHSAGTSYEQMHPLLVKWRAQQGPIPKEADATVEGRFELPLVFQPGSQWAYGPAMDWVGKAVEKATSMTLEEYFKRNIFQPLGVSNASFWPMKDPAMKALMVDLNPSDPEGYGLAPLGGSSSQIGVTDCFGGHGLWMPAQEYLKVLHSLLTNDGKLLQAETVNQMFEPNLEREAHDNLNGNPVGANSPLGVGLPPGCKQDHGLSGILVQQDLPGWYSKGTLTWSGAFNSTWFIDHSSGLCGLGSPQLYLRDALFTRGPEYEFKPHREGAMRWEDLVAYYKQAFRVNIFKVFNSWKGGS